MNLVERTTRTVPLSAHDASSVYKAFAHKLKYMPKQMNEVVADL